MEYAERLSRIEAHMENSRASDSQMLAAIAKVSDDLVAIRERTSKLEVKAGGWGALGGAVTALGILLFGLFK